MSTTESGTLQTTGVAPKQQDTIYHIGFHVAQEFVVKFICPRNKIPDGIQVVPVSGGNSGGGPQSGQTNNFRKVRLDLSGLLSRCTVQSMHVAGLDETRCLVYVNCIVVPGGAGFGAWAGGIYEHLIRSGLSRAWDKAVLRKEEQHGCLSLSLYGAFPA